MVLQVWFKTYRAKLKKAKQQQLAGAEVKTSSSKRNMDAPPVSPSGVYPASLLSTDHQFLPTNSAHAPILTLSQTILLATK